MAGLVILATALTSSFTGAHRANADTYPGRVAHVWLGLGGSPGSESQSQYRVFLDSLHSAAGHAWTNGMMATQSTGTVGQGNALIRVDLNFNDEELRLWVSPDNLYLRGFTNASNETFQFNDSDYDLHSVISGLSQGPNAGLLPPLNQFVTMNFGSNYNSLESAARHGRESMSISYNDLWNSAYNLQYTYNAGSSTAGSLMFMIQYISEAARFWDVYGVMSAIMGSDVVYNGLPIRQQEIENAWDQMTRWGGAAVSGQNPNPYYIGPHAGWISTLAGLAGILWMGLGNPDICNPTGDWGHTEL
jgi:hypothetical protein